MEEGEPESPEALDLTVTQFFHLAVRLQPVEHSRLSYTSDTFSPAHVRGIQERHFRRCYTFYLSHCVFCWRCRGLCPRGLWGERESRGTVGVSA